MFDRLFARLTAFLMGPRALPALFVLFMVPRAAMLLCAVTPTSDAQWYFSRAALMATGAGYIDNHGAATAFWPVGWPMILSLAFRLLGASIWTVGIVNLIAAALSAWLVLNLGRRLSGSELAARIGLLAFAIYPNAILYVPLALTEVVYTALFLGGIWLLVARHGWRANVAAGLVFGLAALVKAQTLVIVPAIMAVALWRTGDMRRQFLPVAWRTALVLGIAGLAIAPWTLRNHRELGAWVVVSTNGGYTLLTGNNDSARGGYTPEDPVVRALEARTDLDELARDREARRLGAAWIAAHPARFAMLAPMKLWRLWGPDGEGEWAYETGSAAWQAAPRAFLALRAVNQAFYWLLLGAFVLAPFAILARRRAAGLPAIDWWIIAYVAALYPSAIAVVFSGQSRFHYPVMPFVCMIAAWLVAQGFEKRAAKRIPA